MFFPQHLCLGVLFSCPCTPPDGIVGKLVFPGASATSMTVIIVIVILVYTPPPNLYCLYPSPLKSLICTPVQLYLIYSIQNWSVLLLNPQILDLYSNGLWTLDSGLWTLDSGLWTLDSGLQTLDSGPWTLDLGLWNLDPGPLNNQGGRHEP